MWTIIPDGLSTWSEYGLGLVEHDGNHPLEQEPCSSAGLGRGRDLQRAPPVLTGELEACSPEGSGDLLWCIRISSVALAGAKGLVCPWTADWRPQAPVCTAVLGHRGRRAAATCLSNLRPCPLGLDAFFLLDQPQQHLNPALDWKRRLFPFPLGVPSGNTSPTEYRQGYRATSCVTP